MSRIRLEAEDMQKWSHDTRPLGEKAKSHIQKSNGISLRWQDCLWHLSLTRVTRFIRKKKANRNKALTRTRHPIKF